MTVHDTFSALGNPVRFAIVERLLREGELSAGEIVAETPMSPPAMSHHFKILREAGVVNQRVDRQRRLYSVRPEAMAAIGTWSLTWRDFWDQSFDRLEAVIDKGEN